MSLGETIGFSLLKVQMIIYSETILPASMAWQRDMEMFYSKKSCFVKGLSKIRLRVFEQNRAQLYIKELDTYRYWWVQFDVDGEDIVCFLLYLKLIDSSEAMLNWNCP